MTLTAITDYTSGTFVDLTAKVGAPTSGSYTATNWGVDSKGTCWYCTTSGINGLAKWVSFGQAQTPTIAGGGGATVSANQGTAAALAGAWPVKVTDGTDLALVSAAGALLVDGSATTQPVSGPLTDTQLRATAVPVSGPLTDTQLRATAVPVSGTVTASGPLTDTQLRASPVPISGTVSVTDGSGPVTVDGTVTANQGTAAAVAGGWPAKITDGTDTLDVLALGAGNSSVPTAAGELTATYNQATTTTALDVSNLSGLYVYAHATANVNFQFSDDGTNWSSPVAVWDYNNASNNLPVGGGSVTLTADHIYVVAICARYFRLVRNSGTITCTVVASNKPMIVPGMNAYASQQGTWTVQPGNSANTTAWLVTASGATPTVSSVAMSTTSATLITSGATRKEAIITNISGQIAYILYGAGTASSTNFTRKLADGETYTEEHYTGAMVAVLAVLTGNILITTVV